jgi:hypothetical protein
LQKPFFDMEADDAFTDREEQDVTATAGTDDASIIKLVNEIIAEAIKGMTQKNGLAIRVVE